jgi:histidyl-tRNA synthetase
VDRIALALGEPEPPGREGVFIVADEGARQQALALAIELRRSGVRADLDLAGRSAKGQMKQADRSGALRAVILDGERATLRDLESGEQRELDRDRLIEEIAAG